MGIQYHGSMDQRLSAQEWIDKCSQRLQERWRTVDPERLEDLAFDLWGDERLRALDPVVAAEEWLRPVLVKE